MHGMFLYVPGGAGELFLDYMASYLFTVRHLLDAGIFRIEFFFLDLVFLSHSSCHLKGF